MSKVLILGGNRFAGKKAALTMKDQGFDVTIFNRSGTKIDPNIKTIKGDRNIRSDLAKLNFADYDAVIDFCLFLPDQALLLSERAAEVKKYIMISSAAVYETCGNLRWDENSRTGLNINFEAYGTDKLECEDIISDKFNNFKILRPGFIDGPHSHRPRISHYIDCLLRGKIIAVAGEGKNVISLVHMDDVVEDVCNLVDFEYGENVFNVSNKEFYTPLILISKVSGFLFKKKMNTTRILSLGDDNAVFPECNFLVDTKFPLFIKNPKTLDQIIEDIYNAEFSKNQTLSSRKSTTTGFK